MKTSTILTVLLWSVLTFGQGLPPAPQPKNVAKTPRVAVVPGKVWVNTKSGAYFCPGARWYGNTKQGQYATESEAKAAGYHPAGGKECGLSGK